MIILLLITLTAFLQHQQLEKYSKKISKEVSSFLTKISTIKLLLSPTTPYKVTNILKTFNRNKRIGPNSLSVKILKNLKSKFSEPLCTLINLSFNTGVFPNSLKLAKVIPAFKIDNQQECDNVRPTSIKYQEIN